MISPTSGGPQAIIVPMAKADPDFVRELAPVIPTDQPTFFVGVHTPFTVHVVQVPSRRPRVRGIFPMKLEFKRNYRS